MCLPQMLTLSSRWLSGVATSMSAVKVRLHVFSHQRRVRQLIVETTEPQHDYIPPETVQGSYASASDTATKDVGNSDFAHCDRPVKGSKFLKKKKKKHRYDTTPSEPIEYTTTISQGKVTIDKNPLAGTGGITEPLRTETVGVQDSDHDAKLSFRPATPPVSVIAEECRQQDSSPHSQLQQDLVAATQAPRTTENDHESSPPPPSPLEIAIPSSGPVQCPRSPSPVRSQSAHYQHANHGVVEDTTVHHVSDRVSPVRVAKRKSKTKRRVAAPPAAEQSSSDINDWFRILQFKVQEKEQILQSQFAIERERLQEDLRQSLDDKRLLEDDLHQAIRHKEDMCETADRQGTKATKYESKFKQFKKFVEGLGSDVTSLRNQANNTQREAEELTQESADGKAEREALYNQMNTCAERSSQLTERTMKLCQETQAELQAAVLRSSYLDQQLSEKVGMLAEERDRRSQLEKQLASVTSSDNRLQHTLQSNNKAILDKLQEMHAVMHENHGARSLSDMLAKTYTAVQSLNSQTSATVDGIASVRDLVEALDERSVSGKYFML